MATTETFLPGRPYKTLVADLRSAPTNPENTPMRWPSMYDTSGGNYANENSCYFNQNEIFER
jgi:hypothetical protein